MKKILCLLLTLLLLLAACAPVQSVPGESLPVEEGQVSRTVKVVDTYENGVLAIQWDEGTYHLELCTIGMKNAAVVDERGESITVGDLRSGMILEVVWDGMVAESWPCQIGADTVRVVEQDDDLVGLYLQVITDLWENDSGLNHDARLLGFDFSTLTNLTKEEVVALEYLASCELGLGLQYVTGTWEELCDQGYIDRENLYWEDGVFLSIKLEETPGETSFTFDAEKWRSGLGAIYFTDCTARRGENGRWSYEAGGFAIA